MVVVPVQSVEGRVVELFFDLLPAVLKDVLALLLGLELIVSGETDALVLVGTCIQFA